MICNRDLVDRIAALANEGIDVSVHSSHLGVTLKVNATFKPRSLLEKRLAWVAIKSAHSVSAVLWHEIDQLAEAIRRLGLI